MNRAVSDRSGEGLAPRRSSATSAGLSCSSCSSCLNTPLRCAETLAIVLPGSGEGPLTRSGAERGTPGPPGTGTVRCLHPRRIGRSALRAGRVPPGEDLTLSIALAGGWHGGFSSFRSGWGRGTLPPRSPAAVRGAGSRGRRRGGGKRASGHGIDRPEIRRHVRRQHRPDQERRAAGGGVPGSGRPAGGGGVGDERGDRRPDQAGEGHHAAAERAGDGHVVGDGGSSRPSRWRPSRCTR
jgi:hypothetical protein